MKYIKKETDNTGLIKIYIINDILEINDWLCVLTTCSNDLANNIYNAYKENEYIEK